MAVTAATLAPPTSAPRWLDDDQQAQWRAYLFGTLALMARLDRDLKSHDLSLSEYEVLVRLSDNPDRRIRMAELAAETNQSRSRLTHTITRMEAAGLVRRRTCDADRRGVYAELTERGHDALVDAAPTHVQGVRDGLIDVVDPADMVAVGRAFTAVRERLEAS